MNALYIEWVNVITEKEFSVTFSDGRYLEYSVEHNALIDEEEATTRCTYDYNRYNTLARSYFLQWSPADYIRLEKWDLARKAAKAIVNAGKSFQSKPVAAGLFW
jgi:hypothetical protein